MRHEEAVVLSAYVDGELSGLELARVKAHLDACGACRAEADALLSTKRLLAGAPRRAMPPGLVASIEARLERPAPARFGWLKSFVSTPRYWAPAATVAAVALVVTTWVHVVQRDPDQYVPLEPLLAAHARYQAESLVPEDNLVAESYSTLTSTDAAPGDPDSE